MPPSPTFLPRLVRRRAAFAALAATVLAAPAITAATQTTDWTVLGQQGLVRFVIVPAEQAGDERAYQQQIVRLCEPERTCFLNFYTNTTGARLALPLPDAVAQEATATYRRSMKNGVQIFMWSCRMQKPGGNCF